jgi:DNA invertase Pin-like site-specific DNA recombinase
MLFGFTVAEAGDGFCSEAAKSLDDFGCHRVLIAKPDRRQKILAAALACLKDGDVLVLPTLSVTGHSLRAFIDMVITLHAQGIGVRSLREDFDSQATASVSETLDRLLQLDPWNQSSD